MSSAFSDIQNLLETQLRDLALDYPIWWENVGGTPNAALPYLAPTFFPVNTKAAGIGSYAQNRHDGFMQVMVHAPANAGRILADSIADQIASGFKRGTSLRIGTTSLTISAVSRTKAQVDAAWYRIPLSITYIAFADN